MSRTNPKNDVESLGGMMLAQQKKNAKGMPERFTRRALPDKPKVRFTDTKTGKTVDIGLCDSLGAIQILKAFGEDL